MYILDFVRPGDKIGIVSTARKVHLQEIQWAIDWLKTLGLQPVIGATIGAEDHQFAGTDEQRAIDFQDMLDDITIKAIWCARGGYGTVRIIDKIDFTNFCKYPKWIIGYSDITVLHAHIHHLGIQSLHAPMPIDIDKTTEKSRSLFKEILFGENIKYTIPSSSNNRLGIGTGQLVGGNLSILYSLCGSVSSLDTSDKILCIEDIDEYYYHIDRMLQNLKRNGYFDNLAGLIVGGMTQMHDNIIPFGKKAEEIIEAIVSDYDFPVAYHFPMGHIKDNYPLMMGANASLVVHQDNVTLSYL